MISVFVIVPHVQSYSSLGAPFKISRHAIQAHLRVLDSQ